MSQFDEIITVAGKPGLFRIIKPTRNGYVAEELQEGGKRLVLNQNHRISFLKEISIYTLDGEGSVPIGNIMDNLKRTFPQGLDEATRKDPSKKFVEVLPNYDPDRVYASDIKKLFKWFELLTTLLPDITFLQEPPKEEKTKEKKGAKKSTEKKK